MSIFFSQVCYSATLTSPTLPNPLLPVLKVILFGPFYNKHNFFILLQASQSLERTTMSEPTQGPYNGPLPHIYPNLYTPGAPLYDPRVHGEK